MPLYTEKWENYAAVAFKNVGFLNVGIPILIEIPIFKPDSNLLEKT